jgi:hypothetical protein
MQTPRTVLIMCRTVVLTLRRRQQLRCCQPSHSSVDFARSSHTCIIVCVRLAQTLKFGASFDQPIGDLPVALQSLIFGRLLDDDNGKDDPDQDLDLNMIENSVYDWPLGPLPCGLTRLDLARLTAFNQPLGRLPASLTVSAHNCHCHSDPS